MHSTLMVNVQIQQMKRVSNCKFDSNRTNSYELMILDKCESGYVLTTSIS